MAFGNGDTLQQRPVAAKHGAAVELGADTLACQLFYSFRGSQRQRPFSGGFQNTDGDGVGGMLLAGGAKRQYLVAGGMLYLKFAFGQRAGLIHGNCLYGGQGLHGVAAFEQDTLPAAHTNAAEEGKRYTEHQGAGAAHDQEGQGGVDPVAPVSGGHRGDDRHRCRGADHNGGVDGGEAGDEPLDFGLGRSGGFYRVQDSGDHGFRQGCRHGHGKLTA